MRINLVYFYLGCPSVWVQLPVLPLIHLLGSVTGLVVSKYSRQASLLTFLFSSWNSFSWLSGHWKRTSFFSSFMTLEVRSDMEGINWLKYFIMPRSECSSCLVEGNCIFLDCFYFLGIRFHSLWSVCFTKEATRFWLHYAVIKIFFDNYYQNSFILVEGKFLPFQQSWPFQVWGKC